MKNKITKYIIVFLAIIIFLKLFAIDVFIVNGVSMYPTIKDQEIIISEKLTYIFSKPKVSDIVIVNGQSYIVKRIVAKENDIIEFKNNSMYVNNKLKIKDIETKGERKIKVPKNCYYIIGDNYKRSIDSRQYGPVNQSKITSKYVCKI